jgi:hypothetical protein
LKQADRNRNNVANGLCLFYCMPALSDDKLISLCVFIAAAGNPPVNSTSHPTPSDMRRAYDALGIQCPTSASGMPTPVNTVPGPGMPIIRGANPAAPVVKRSNSPNANMPINSGDQNQFGMQLFGINQHQQGTPQNQPNQSGQPNLNAGANQDISQQVS